MHFRCEKKNCGGKTSPKVIDYKPKYKSLPKFSIKNVKAECCDKCGEIFGFDNEACEHIDAAIDFEIKKRLMNLPLNDFVAEKTASQMLKMKTKTLKDRMRIGRGFVYHINHDGVEFYNVKSIEMYLLMEDGRFPLKPV